MPETATNKPFQFGLASLFVATSAVAVAFGVVHWFGPDGFVGLVIVASITVFIASISAWLVGGLVSDAETSWSSRLLRWAWQCAAVSWLALLFSFFVWVFFLPDFD